MAELPPPDRSQITADLQALSRLAHRRVATAMQAMPRLIRGPLERAGLDPGPTILRLFSAPTALSDAELVVLIEAAAQQLGAWRGVRPPAQRTPELEAALRHLRELAGL